jgi:hypothetical protein
MMTKVLVRLPPGLATAVRRTATAEGVSVSEWIRSLVQQGAAGPAREVHLLREDCALACGQDGRVYSSGVLAEVTCEACKAATG